MKTRLLIHGLSGNTLIALVTMFFVAGANHTFLANVLEHYPLDSSNATYLVSLVLVFVAINAVIFSLAGFGRLLKAVLILFLLLSSLAAYFMDSYGIVISDEMLRNAIQTNAAETLDLMTWKLLGYFIFLGVLPGIIVARIPLRWNGWQSN